MAKFSLIPKQTNFYDFFEKLSANLVKASKELSDLFENYDNIQLKVKFITELEHNNDAITHQVMDQLHRTFVTPLDREDIALLTYRLDDVMDFIEDTANAMLLYNISKPTEYSKKLAKIIITMAESINRAIPLLRNKKHMKKILEECVEINRLENDADEILRQSTIALFNCEKPDAIEILKWREIYEWLESASDRGEDVANVLEGVVIKYS